MTPEPEYVGFWARVAASLIDTVMLLLVVVPMAVIVLGAQFFTDPTLSTDSLGSYFVSYGVPAILVLSFWILRQATPGKMVIQAVIVDARTGGVPTTAQWILRYLGYWISTLPLFLGLIWVAIDPKKRGFHDLIAGTVVIRKRA